MWIRSEIGAGVGPWHKLRDGKFFHSESQEIERKKIQQRSRKKKGRWIAIPEIKSASEV